MRRQGVHGSLLERYCQMTDKIEEFNENVKKFLRIDELQTSLIEACDLVTAVMIGSDYGDTDREWNAINQWRALALSGLKKKENS